MLKVAIQKKGRLHQNSIKLFENCGIKVPYSGDSRLRTVSNNFPIEFLFLRDDDIPQYVEQQVADIGILGNNVVVEKRKKIDISEKLAFSSCRLSLAIPKSHEYPGLNYFQNKRIATSYPNILGDFLRTHNINARIEEITGSVEIAPSIGLADGVCDIVSTGSTLIMNGLKEVQTIFDSEAVLVSNQKLSEEKKLLLEKLLFRIRAVKNASENKYILLNAPNEAIDRISAVLPGIKSPTVLPLAQEGWSSIHAVIKEKAFWEVINQLKELGAQGILVIPIEKMVV